MFHTSRSTLVLTAAFAVTTLTGCTFAAQSASPSSSSTSSTSSTSSSAESSSSSDAELPDASTIVDRAQKVLGETKTLTYRSTIKTKGVTTTISVRGSFDAKGSVAQTSSHPKKGTEELLLVDSALYVKGDATYWGPKQADLAGKWGKVPDGADKKEAISEMTMSKVLASVTSTSSDLMAGFFSDGATVETTMLKGQRAYLVTNDTDDMHLWIAADGTDQILKMDGIEYADGSTGVDEYSGYNAAYDDIVKPKHAINLTSDDAPATT